MTQEVQPDVATVEQAESPLVELLQRPGCARMLDAFLSNRGLWLTEAHLEELAEVNQSTVNRNIDAFEEVSLVESRGSHPTQYRLDEEHPAVDPLLEAHRELYRDTAEMTETVESEDVESPFYILVNTEGRVRILDAFLSNRGLWLTEAHLEELAEVNQSTVNRNIDAFEEVSLVESRGSHPTQYRLDEEHPAVDPLLEAHRELYRDTARLADHNWAITVPTAESAKDEVQASLETLKIEFKGESASVRLDTTDRDEEQLLHDRSDEEAQLKEKLRELIENAQSRGDEEDPDKEPHHHDGEPGFRGVNSRSKMAAATAVRNHSTSQPA
jgi:DNA-binding MarR family transcriptional regulator